jgi:hypothetical protein
MARHLRTSLVVILVLAGSVIPASATRAAIAPGCANPVDSALNQYCDSIPSASGPHSPTAGTPSVATTLPRAAVARINGADSRSGGTRGGHARARKRARRALLSLPAPGPRAALSDTRAAITGGWLLPLWLTLVLIGLAVAMIAATVGTRYRQRGKG